MKNLQYFREIESENDPNRADPYEGSIWLDAGIELMNANTGETLTISKESLDDIQMYTNWTNHVNLFCLCKIPIPDTAPGEKGVISIPNQLFVFGDYGVLIKNASGFLERVKAALIKDGRYQMGLGEVIYSDVSPKDMNSPETIFHKREIYKCQNEYRIAVLTAPDTHDHLTLEAGDLSDITAPFTWNRQG